MERSNYQIFKQLHYHQEPLLLPNAWDAKSAKTFQDSGFEAVGTSSAAVANALGYDDGEHIPFHELLFVVQRICRSTNLLLLRTSKNVIKIYPIKFRSLIELLV